MKSGRMLVVGLAAAMALTACGGDDADTAEGSAAGSGSGTSSKEAPEASDIRLWLNGADTPQEARDWLKQTFEEQNPGSTLSIEQQDWEGLVERLVTALGSKSESPDVVEVGNTQTATFSTVGAFSDLTDHVDELGGDELLAGFVAAGEADGKNYAVPYYAGSKFVFYRKDLFEQAGVEVPTTLDEFVDTAITLKEANADNPSFSGFWFPGQDWRNGATFVWAKGGELAVEEGGEWRGALSTPESIEGLQLVQTLFQEASGAPVDANEADPQIGFCAGDAAMISVPGWIRGTLEDPEVGCPELMENVGVFALPGEDGEAAPVLLGGSNIAVSAASPNQELAVDLVDIMTSEEYQTILAENALTPALQSMSGLLGNDEFAQATIEAAQNAKLTPPAAGWAQVEGSRILEDLFVNIAQGGDVEQLAAKADAALEAQLN